MFCFFCFFTYVGRGVMKKGAVPLTPGVAPGEEAFLGWSRSRTRRRKTLKARHFGGKQRLTEQSASHTATNSTYTPFNLNIHIQELAGRPQRQSGSQGRWREISWSEWAGTVACLNLKWSAHLLLHLLTVLPLNFQSLLPAVLNTIEKSQYWLVHAANYTYMKAGYTHLHAWGGRMAWHHHRYYIKKKKTSSAQSYQQVS